MSKLSDRIKAEKIQVYRANAENLSIGHIATKAIITRLINRGSQRLFIKYLYSKMPPYMAKYAVEQVNDLITHSMMPQDSNKLDGRDQSFGEDDEPFPLAPDSMMVGYQKIYKTHRGPVYRPFGSPKTVRTASLNNRSSARHRGSQTRDDSISITSMQMLTNETINVSEYQINMRKQRLMQKNDEASFTLVDLKHKEMSFDEEMEEKFETRLREHYLEKLERQKIKKEEDEEDARVHLENKKKILYLEKNSRRPFTYGFDGKIMPLKKTILPRNKLVPQNTTYQIPQETNIIQADVRQIQLQDIQTVRWFPKNKHTEGLLEKQQNQLKMDKEIRSKLDEERRFERIQHFLSYYGIKVDCRPHEFEWTEDLFKKLDDKRQNSVIKHIVLNPGVSIKETKEGSTKVRTNKDKQTYYDSKDHSKLLSREEYQALTQNKGSDAEQEFMKQLLNDDFGALIKKQDDTANKKIEAANKSLILDKLDEIPDNRIPKYQYNGLPQRYQLKPIKPEHKRTSIHNIIFEKGFREKIIEAEKRRLLPIESVSDVSTKVFDEKITDISLPLKPSKIQKENIMERYIEKEKSPTNRRKRFVAASRSRSHNNSYYHPGREMNLDSLNISAFPQKPSNNNQSLLVSEASHIMDFSSPNCADTSVNIGRTTKGNFIKVFKNNILDELKDELKEEIKNDDLPVFLTNLKQSKLDMSQLNQISSRQQLSDIGEFSRNNF